MSPGLALIFVPVQHGLLQPEPVVALAIFIVGQSFRITSYNVCYTKLLRLVPLLTYTRFALEGEVLRFPRTVISPVIHPFHSQAKRAGVGKAAVKLPDLQAVFQATCAFHAKTLLLKVVTGDSLRCCCESLATFPARINPAAR